VAATWRRTETFCLKNRRQRVSRCRGNAGIGTLVIIDMFHRRNAGATLTDRMICSARRTRGMALHLLRARRRQTRAWQHADNSRVFFLGGGLDI